MIHYISGVKDKSHIIISKDTERAFNNTQYPFMIRKTLNYNQKKIIST